MDETDPAWRALAERLLQEVLLPAHEPASRAVVELVGDDTLRAPLVRLEREGVGEEARIRAELLWAPEPLPVEELLALGWQPPEREPEEEAPGSHRHVLRPAGATVEDVAWFVGAIIRTLRGVHGVLHPAFLIATGLSLDGLRRADPPGRRVGPRPVEGLDVVAARVPRDPEHLRSLVHAALTEHLGRPPVWDVDGDAEVPVGGSLVWVRVLEHRPWIELFAHLVVDLRPGDPAIVEAVEELSEALPWLRFEADGEQIVAVHTVCALPFCDVQMQHHLAAFAGADVLAGEIAARLGGQRFLAWWAGRDDTAPLRPAASAATASTRPVPAGAVERDEEPLEPADALSVLPQGAPTSQARLAALVLLLEAGPVDAALVASIFGSRRTELVAAMGAVRTSPLVPAHRVETVVSLLREALWGETRGVVVADASAVMPPPVRAPRSRQLSLLGDDDGELLWDDDLE